MNIEEKYEKDLKYIQSLKSSRKILGLDRIKKVLTLFDNPQEKLNIVHIAGTNGKGSTTTMLSTVYEKAGYCVGTFISPYVVEYRERIQCNGKYIEKEIFCDLVDKIKDTLETSGNTLTCFEFTTVMAFLYYELKHCDIVFLEVGLGGKSDATNVIKNPLVSVITKIDYDHTAILGNTLIKITFEKCGIIKQECPVVLYIEQEKDVLETVKEVCKEKHSKLVIPEKEKLKIKTTDVLDTKIEYKHKEYSIGLHGSYQIDNTLTVLTAIEVLAKKGFDPGYEATYQGIKQARFPGRFEIVQENPRIILDGAHNPSGIEVLMKSICQVQTDSKIAMVSILENKDREAMIKEFATYFDKIIVLPIYTSRGTPIEELYDQIKKYNTQTEMIESYEEALKKANQYAKKSGSVFVFGSLRLISEIRRMLLTK